MSQTVNQHARSEPDRSGNDRGPMLMTGNPVIDARVHEYIRVTGAQEADIKRMSNHSAWLGALVGSIVTFVVMAAVMWIRSRVS